MGEEKVVVNDKGELEITIEGIGKINEIGKLNVEGLFESLLKNKYIIS